MDIHTILAATVPPQGIAMQADNFETSSAVLNEPLTIAINTIRKAKRDRDIAAVAVVEAESAIKRIKKLITDADDADIALTIAKEVSANFTQRWVESGAPVNSPSADPKLAAKVDIASKKAIAARIAAVGCDAGMGAAWSTLATAKADLKTREWEIGQAVNKATAGLAETYFTAATKASAEFAAVIPEIEALASILDRPTANLLLDRLDSITPRYTRRGNELDRAEELKPRAHEWRELKARLQRSSDAE